MRHADIARRQHAGGHLVEQRLEGVEVPLVEQRDVVAAVAQLARGEQAAEAAADDDDAMWLMIFAHVDSAGGMMSA